MTPEERADRVLGTGLARQFQGFRRQIAEEIRDAVTEATKDRAYQCGKCGLQVQPVTLIRKIIECPDCKSEAHILPR